MHCYVVGGHCAVPGTITAYSSTAELIPGGTKKVKSYYIYSSTIKVTALEAEKVKEAEMQNRDINKVIYLYISTTTL